jgi:hypothetical protein
MGGRPQSLCRRREQQMLPLGTNILEQIQEDCMVFDLYFRACFPDVIIFMRTDGINVSNWILDAKQCRNDLLSR